MTRRRISVFVFLGLIILVVAGVPSSFAQTETITITTYYPSPFGIYNELRAKKMAIGASYYNPAGTSINDPADLIVEGNVGVGTSSPASMLSISGGASIGSGYVGTAAPADGMIIQGDVGIGVSNPRNTLDVEGKVAIGASYSGANVAPDNGMIVEGSVGIGTTSLGGRKLKVDGGDVEFTGTLYVSDIYGADIAETYLMEGKASPGDVMVVDVNNDERLVKSKRPYSLLVAGVVSSKPAIVIGRDKRGGRGSYKPLALKGIVLCKVTSEGGEIRRGDILVTSSKPGYAMKADLRKITVPTQVVGIALGELKDNEGKIYVFVK